MIVYWTACFISMGIAWIGMHSKQFLNTRKITGIVIFSCLPLLLLSALRYGIGTDYSEYISIYNTYTSKGIRGAYEPLFYLLGWFLSRFNADGQILIAVCSIIYIVIIYYCIFKESPKPIYSIYLLVATTFYMSSFNTIREHVGAAILLLSLLLFEKKKYIFFISLVIVALGFHYSCALYFVVFLLARIKMTPKKVVIFTGVFLISRPLLVNIVYRILSGTVYARYLGISSSSSVAMYFGMAVQFGILLFASVFYKKDDSRYNLYYSLQVVATWITLLNGVLPLASRVRWIFSLPSIILIPLTLNNIQDKRVYKIAYIGIIVLFFIYASIVVGVSGSYGVIPYKSILN